jgi:hypothetical protein
MLSDFYASGGGHNTHGEVHPLLPSAHPVRMAKLEFPRWKARFMQYNLHPFSEHELYIRLFITNGGGW